MVEHGIKASIISVVDDVSDWAAGDYVTYQVEKSERLVSLVSESVTKTPYAVKDSAVPPSTCLCQSDEDITFIGLAAFVVRVELSGVVFIVVTIPEQAANRDRKGVIGVPQHILPKLETTLDGIWVLAVGESAPSSVCVIIEIR